MPSAAPMRRNSCAAAWKARLRICLGSSRMPLTWRLSRHSMPIRWPSRWAWPSARSAPSSSTNSGTMPSSIFRPRRLDAVVVGDLEAPGEDVAQQSEGLALRLRRGAAAEEEEALGARLAPGLELVEQPALADAGVGDHGDGGQLALGEQPLEGGLQRLELGVAADHPRRHAFDAAAADAKAARLGAQHQVALDRRRPRP